MLICYCDGKYILCCYRNKCGAFCHPPWPRPAASPPSHHPVLQAFCLPPAAHQRALPHPWRTAFVNVTRCLRSTSLSGCLESISVVPTDSPGTRVNPATSAVHDRHPSIRSVSLRSVSFGLPEQFLFLNNIARNQNCTGQKKFVSTLNNNLQKNQLSICVGSILLC